MKAAIFPLPILDGLAPEILLLPDRGVELAYPKPERDHWIPPGTPVLSPNAGVVLHVGREPGGFTMLIDHGNDWMTSFARLVDVLDAAAEGKRVAAGQPIGYAEARPGQRLLQFELWRSTEDGCEPISPIQLMRRWRYIDSLG